MSRRERSVSFAMQRLRPSGAVVDGFVGVWRPFDGPRASSPSPLSQRLETEAFSGGRT